MLYSLSFNIILLIYVAKMYIIYFKLNNTIFRYATTLITSKVSNPENTSREVFMSVILPETAFISRFAIQVGEQVFVAFVKEKEDAWRQYQDAVTKGKTAGKFIFTIKLFYLKE